MTLKDVKEHMLTKEILDEIRNIPGFPIGTDDDIIALSNPPHYTACPNPFLTDFIKHLVIPFIPIYFLGKKPS